VKNPVIFSDWFLTYSQGQKYPLWQVKPPHEYNVLSWFFITHMWLEKDAVEDGDDVKFWKIRLERPNDTIKPWWMPAGSKREVPVQRLKRSKAIEETECPTCGLVSPRIFKEQFICMRAECSACLSTQHDLDFDQLHYSSKVVNASLGLSPPAYNWFPDDGQPVLDEENSFGTGKRARLGIKCPRCGCLSRRVFWDRWTCENGSCDHVQIARPSPISAELVLQETRRSLSARSKPFKSTSDMELHHCVHTIKNWEVHSFHLPDPANSERLIGKLSIFRANSNIHNEPSGPNEIWNSLQTGEINGLRRNPVRHPNRKSFTQRQSSSRRIIFLKYHYRTRRDINSTLPS
jgi:hypothetical protein